MVLRITREQVLSFRIGAQALDRGTGTLADTGVLDIGVQDTGPDGSLWALLVRGVDPAALSAEALATVWSLRGAPHAYRRADLSSVATAVQPFSEADAAKRIFDAAKPLTAAGISCLHALDTVAERMRGIVTEPMTKGTVSTALTAQLEEPYLRYCRSCAATHCYEQPLRLSALRGGLQLQPGTSPPVLERIPGHRPSTTPLAQHQVVRAYVRLLGPATPRQVARYLDAPLTDVQQRWPLDAEPVDVEGEQRWVLGDDVPALQDAAAVTARLLGPFDLFLQARDRDLLVPDAASAKALWPVLGRPGALLLGRQVVGSWRPRKARTRLSVVVTPWRRLTAREVADLTEQAERLAAFRDVRLGAVTVDE